MELAGQEVAHATYTYIKPGQSVVVICGPGSLSNPSSLDFIPLDNGGDGLVAARHLHFLGVPVSVFLRHNLLLYE